ncbi:hypothetical protein Rhopal_006991-T1 [Rhodotorula paludigena]|uniref:Proteophosphoglycan ppg4 n=1 Tax=Rhodotorula paludigena TaxID=86838 RepID=A0AAV5GWS5_9BASI|nr:hypothetical protein Rhopal_006991-T1 [Rhodotorula paludigena]
MGAPPPLRSSGRVPVPTAKILDRLASTDPPKSGTRTRPTRAPLAPQSDASAPAPAPGSSVPPHPSPPLPAVQTAKSARESAGAGDSTSRPGPAQSPALAQLVDALRAVLQRVAALEAALQVEQRERDELRRAAKEAKEAAAAAQGSQRRLEERVQVLEKDKAQLTGLVANLNVKVNDSVASLEARLKAIELREAEEEDADVSDAEPKPKKRKAAADKPKKSKKEASESAARESSTKTQEAKDLANLVRLGLAHARGVAEKDSKSDTLPDWQLGHPFDYRMPIKHERNTGGVESAKSWVRTNVRRFAGLSDEFLKRISHDTINNLDAALTTAFESLRSRKRKQAKPVDKQQAAAVAIRHGARKTRKRDRRLRALEQLEKEMKEPDENRPTYPAPESLSSCWFWTRNMYAEERRLLVDLSAMSTDVTDAAGAESGASDDGESTSAKTKSTTSPRALEWRAPTATEFFALLDSASRSKAQRDRPATRRAHLAPQPSVTPPNVFAYLVTPSRIIERVDAGGDLSKLLVEWDDKAKMWTQGDAEEMRNWAKGEVREGGEAGDECEAGEGGKPGSATASDINMEDASATSEGRGGARGGWPSEADGFSSGGVAEDGLAPLSSLFSSMAHDTDGQFEPAELAIDPALLASSPLCEREGEGGAAVFGDENEDEDDLYS